MIQLVQKYNTYLRSLPELISKTHFKAAYFQKILGLKRPTYYRKLRYNAFNSDEVEIITKALYPKEAFMQELKKDLKESDQDYKNQEVKEHEEIMSSLTKKYLEE